MFSDDMAEYGQLTFEKGYRSMNSALRKKKKFTAVFAFSDETAVGAITALNEHGLKVPEDVSVLGFDGLSISERVVPKLTTIYQPWIRWWNGLLRFCVTKVETEKKI